MWRVLRSPTWITLCFARHSDELDNLMTQFFVRADYENLWRLRPLTYLSWWDRGFMGEGYKVCCQHRFHPYQGRLTGEILLRAANSTLLVHMNIEHWRKPSFIVDIWTKMGLVDRGNTPLSSCKSEIFDISSHLQSLVSILCPGQGVVSVGKMRDIFFVFKHFPSVLKACFVLIWSWIKAGTWKHI